MVDITSPSPVVPPVATIQQKKDPTPTNISHLIICKVEQLLQTSIDGLIKIVGKLKEELDRNRFIYLERLILILILM